MAKPPAQIPLSDPHNVEEMICDGGLNVVIHGNLGTLIFTHVRPNAAKLFESGELETEAVVRARIVMTVDNFVALRDLLNRIIKDRPTPTSGPTIATSTKPH